MYGQAFEVPDSVMSKDFVLPLGKAKIQREGKHISIFTFSKMVGKSVQAAEILAKEGIEVEVKIFFAESWNRSSILEPLSPWTERPLWNRSRRPTELSLLRKASLSAVLELKSALC